MATKYFCDCCNNEIERRSLIQEINMNEIEPEIVREINRSDVSNYMGKIKKEICFYCRVAIINFLKDLSVKESK